MNAEEARATANQLPETAMITRGVLHEIADAADETGQLPAEAAIAALINAVRRLEFAIQEVARMK